VKEASNPVKAEVKVAKAVVNAKTPHLAVCLSEKELHQAVFRKAEHHVVSVKRTKVHLPTERRLLYGRRKSNRVSLNMK
jgi:hypothetical protein